MVHLCEIYYSLQVTQLKASRDKLLAELDIQFVEAERLGNESSALSQVRHPST